MATQIIKQGDTLSQIATQKGTTVDELLRLNPNIQDPNLIFAGATLQIPEEIVAPQEQVTPPEEPLVTAPEVIEAQAEQTRAVATAEEAAGITEENQIRLAEMEAAIAPAPEVPEVPPTPLVPPTPPTEEVAEPTAEEVVLRESLEDIDREVAEVTGILDARATQLDVANQALVTSIKSIFDRRREQQKELNKRTVTGLTITGIRAGRQRFAPEVQAGILSAEERAGIQRIADLDAQELSLIQEAKAANDANQFALLNEKMNAIAASRSDKSNVIKQLHDMAVEEEKLLRARAQEERAVRKEARDIAREGDIDGGELRTIGNQIIRIKPDGTTEVIFEGDPEDDPFTNQQKFQNTLSLRKEFDDQSGDFIKIRDSLGRVKAATADPSAAGDLALIFNFMKILDPGSVVRESEFATASNAAGVPERIRAQYNNVLRGERLSEATREDFVTQAGNLFQSQKEQQDRLQEEFRDFATAFDLDPNRIPNLSGEETPEGITDEEFEILRREFPDLTDEDIQGLSFSGVGSDTQAATSVIIPESSRLSFVNNNPGNLKFANQTGAVEGEGGFAKFKSPLDGFKAIINQINLDASRGLNLGEFVFKYAPPTENDTTLYLKQIVNATSTSPTIPLKDVNVNSLAKAIAIKESSTTTG